VTVTSKLAVRMDPQSTKSAVFDLMSWTLFHEDRRSMEKAFEIAENFRLSFWDANILSAALLSNCEALYTEDLPHGQSIDGLRIVNPFL